MPELLNVKDLRVYYRIPGASVRAVDGLSFTVKKNEVFGIVGESGSGKTTLAVGILRLNKPPCFVESGEVIFDGEDILRIPEGRLRELRLTHLSYIPQSAMNALNPVLRVRDQLLDAMESHGMRRSEGQARIKELLEMVGLPPEVAGMYPHELSGGMKQRVIIAIATAMKPKLIVADEPTTALDVVVQRRVLEFLLEIREKLGASLIVITHDIAVQAEIVDRLGVMYAGKMVEIGNVHDIFKDPLHPYTSGLMMSTPILGEKKALESIPGTPPSLINPPPGCRFHPRCPFASEECKRMEPPFHEVGASRFVACWRYK